MYKQHVSHAVISGTTKLPFTKNETILGAKGEPGMKGEKGEPGLQGRRGYAGADGLPVSYELPSCLTSDFLEMLHLDISLFLHSKFALESHLIRIERR